MQSSPKSSPKERTLMRTLLSRSPLSLWRGEMSEGQWGEDFEAYAYFEHAWGEKPLRETVPPGRNKLKSFKPQYITTCQQ
jgi:hypothetical protein